MVVKRKKKDNDDMPDNKWELGAFIIKHWLKAVAVIIALGLAASGFSIKCKDKEFSKDPLYKTKTATEKGIEK